MGYQDNSTKERARETAESIRQGIHDTVNTAADTANRMTDNLGDRGEQLLKSQGKNLEEYSSWVRDNPIKAVLTAAGAGYLFSKIF
jgi:ElaB/YqjD/DUF883 family membrane-anchored ribosome-binding protein